MEGNQQQRKYIQNFILVWIDYNKEKALQNWVRTCDNITNKFFDVYIFDDVNEAIDNLTDIETAPVVLILSPLVVENLLHHLYCIQNIYAVYMFSDNQSVHELPNVTGIYTETIGLAKKIEQDIESCRKYQSQTFSVLKSATEDEPIDPNELDPSFIYAQLFKEAFIEMEFDGDYKKYLIAHWYRLYGNNTKACEFFETFRRDYNSENTIEWYTKSSYVYEMLNRALRLLDTEIILDMGFYIKDLQLQLEHLHKQQRSSRDDNKFTVYRGQKMTKKEFCKIQRTQNCLLAFNNFLSTSPDENFCRRFIAKSQETLDTLFLLFIIEVDPRIDHLVYADVTRYNVFDEYEILFGMNTIFTVNSTAPMPESTNVHVVQLSATGQQNQYLECLKHHLAKGHTGAMKLMQTLLNLHDPETINKAVRQISMTEFNADRLFNLRGFIASSHGDFDSSIILHSEALKIIEKTQLENHPDIVSTHNSIGNAYAHKGEYSRALSEYEKALKIRKKIVPENHPDIASTHNNMGNVYLRKGDYSRALSEFERALKIMHGGLPENHPHIALAHSSIGNVYLHKGDYSRALSEFGKALKIMTKALPENHTNIALIHSSIGNAYSHKGDYSRALTEYAQDLKIRKKAVSENHPDIALAHNNIGNLHAHMGDHTHALTEYEQALKIMEKTLPENHPDVALAHNNIGNVYLQKGDHTHALAEYQQALKIMKKTLPENHPDVALAHNNIGNVYLQKGDHTHALAEYQQALKIMEKALPENHPNIAMTYSNIGNAYAHQGDYTHALAEYEKARKIMHKGQSENHPDIASTHTNIGSAYLRKGDYSRALSEFEEALKMMPKALPENHPNIALTHSSIGNAYLQKGDYSRAQSEFEEALKMMEKASPKNHPDIASTHNNLGNAYLRKGDHSRALSEFEEALKIMTKSLPENHPNIALVHESIGSAYAHKGEYSWALSKYEQALTIRKKASPENVEGIFSLHKVMGEVYRKTKDYGRAIVEYQEALRIAETVSLENPRFLIVCKFLIGICFVCLSDKPSALQWLLDGKETAAVTMDHNIDLHIAIDRILCYILK